MPHRELDFDRAIGLTKEERAYMAGFFDGEGYVSMSIDPRRKNHVQCVVGISQKRHAVLSYFHEIFGGSLFIRTSSDPARFSTQAVSVWSTGNRGTIRLFHRLVSPYLRVKQEEFALTMTILTNPKPSIEFAKETMQLIRSIRTDPDRPIAVGE